MNLPKEVGKTARETGKSFAFAESVTGGLAASLVTDVPGSSRYFFASFVTYSNESKVNVLWVNEDTLLRYGAVSAQVAKQMASGARRVAGSDVGASCSGIAGPGGATDAKPIGLVYFAVDDGTRVFSEKQIFYGDRWAIKSQAAIRMLELVNSALKGRKASRGRSHRERAD